jgi:hypoxanthine-DNA glycosylase
VHCSGIAQSVGFGAAARGDARVLVLGSLPGQISLQQGEYYANPHNAFWKIMEKLFGAPRDMPYAARLRRLNESGIALWDVCASGQRPGSLDSKLSNIVANDFGSFFSSHPSIGLVCFNGATAAKLYSRKVLPWLADRDAAIRREVLPSTSPAHAAMPLERKLSRWREVLLPALEPTPGRI